MTPTTRHVSAGKLTTSHAFSSHTVRLALRALLRMDLVRRSPAASSETTVFLKKWTSRLVEAAAKTGSTYLTPTSLPQGKLSVVRSALDVVVDIVEANPQLGNTLTDLIDQLSRYVDSDDLPTSFSANKLVIVLAEHGKIREESRETLLNAVLSRLELIQMVLKAEGEGRLPLADLSINLVTSSPTRHEETLSASLRRQMEILQTQLVLSACALFNIQLSIDEMLTGALCGAIDLFIDVIQQSNQSNDLIASERVMLTSKALSASIKALGKLSNADAGAIRYFFSQIEADRIRVLKSVIDVDEANFFCQRSNRTTPIEMDRRSLPTRMYSPTLESGVHSLSRVSVAEVESEASGYEMMEDSDTVQLDAASELSDSKNSKTTEPLASSPYNDDKLENIHVGMQCLNVDPSQERDLNDVLSSIEKRCEEEKWRSLYELSEATRANLQSEVATKDAQIRELERELRESKSRLELATEENNSFRISLEAKAQELDHFTVQNTEKSAKIDLLEKGLDEAWMKLKVRKLPANRIYSQLSILGAYNISRRRRVTA